VVFPLFQVDENRFPDADGSLEAAAKPFVLNRGARDALTLVRAQKYASTPEQLAEIEVQREYAAVHVIPEIQKKDPTKSTILIPMGEWMAERATSWWRSGASTTL
jgi:uncharacterized protein